MESGGFFVGVTDPSDRLKQRLGSFFRADKGTVPLGDYSEGEIQTTEEGLEGRFIFLFAVGYAFKKIWEILLLS